MLHRARPLPLTATLAVAIALGGCGPGAGPSIENVSVRVTSDFGAHVIGRAAEASVPGAETVMAVTEQHFAVRTRYGGAFVEAIRGRSGSDSHLDWFYYVNGIEAPAGAAATDVQTGDRIWWDLHDWTATDSIPAVVGSYPEPFTGGTLPTHLDCASNAQQACDMVAGSLQEAGVRVVRQRLKTRSRPDSLTVVVGTWAQVSRLRAAGEVAGGPRASGIYAEFTGRSGRTLELDNPRGDVAETLHGNAGLIAATKSAAQREPLWFVTGTGPSGVRAAAQAFNAAALQDHFAVALSARRIIPIPTSPGS